MPFVQRVVSPVYIARTTKATGRPQSPPKSAPEAGCSAQQTQCDDQIVQKVAPVSDHELEAVTNVTLSNALKQLASLVLIANDIFTELNSQLQGVSDRSRGIKQRIDVLQQRVEEFDPKMVAVPEGDLATFVHIKKHFKSTETFATALFTPATRSEAVRNLYESAAKTPVCVMREMDHLLGQDGRRTSVAEIFMCTPVLGQTRRRMRRNIDVEIETRMPAAIDDLRKWTSLEAIGDITVTPDCVARVGFTGQMNSTDASGHPSVVVTPCTPPSGDEDEPDDITVVSSYRVHDTLPASPDDMPLDHRLPSPEEQCQILALKFPAEVVSVDISGKRFDRMCHTRKSLLHTHIAGSASESGVSSPLSDCVDNQTVKRRSRPKKPRGKRRNTLAGTDQKEIQEAANGEPEIVTAPDNTDDFLTVVPRSKSSDILKRDPFAVDSGRTLSTHFNSLKQWGMNRLRMINRNSNEDRKEVQSGAKSSDIDDFNVHESIGNRNRRKLGEKERKLSHERKPSYSSSEKSISIASPASINPVKLRESSSIRRQRRIGMATREEPNSSSGNWSASSESGRTSIGSEITAQPKSSASSNSLNHNHHPGSGPPSSIISRRRFLNTSASSSVTSEGTATPDLQVHEMLYDDGETSSAYSCDTEGYYTSFHVDSGLKTLKEEEPVTPLHTSSALSSTNSFSSSGNQTVLSAENEYELFGRGSTSTTTSSAGTVCTTLKAAGSDRSLIVGPTVPERKSSLTKLNRSSSTNSGGTLERSYSSSTVGSTLERTGTIKRNGVLLQKEVAAIVHQHHQEQQKETRTDSPDSGNNTSSSPVESNANSSPTQGVRSYSEFEYSESSDLEGVDRIERIRNKTTINSSRIPSMCVITPTNSDDEYQTVIGKKSGSAGQRQKLDIPLQETDLDSLEFNTASKKANSDRMQIITVNQSTGYATVQTVDTPKLTTPSTSTKSSELKKEVQYVKKTTLLPLNSMLGKLKGVLPNLSKLKSPQKESQEESSVGSPPDPDTSGEYVTIADVKNNNKTPTGGVYYSNDLVKRNLATVLSGNLAEETEYVSLNELPANMRCESNLLSPSIASTSEKKIDTETENESRRGARVMLDAQGKVVYSSDSLKRRKGAHTTFAPGPCVKDTSQSQVNPTTGPPTTPGGLSNRKPTVVRPVPIINPARKFASENQANTANEPLKEEDENTHAPQLPSGEVEVKTQPSMLPIGSLNTGAYVNLQCDEDTYLPPPPPLISPLIVSSPGYLPSYHDDTRTHLATLPRAVAYPVAPPAVYESVGSTYWTLQARKPSVEALYSTPNKPKRTPLKTTPIGFETFFSPVKESSRPDESPTESPIDPRSGGSMRTSTPSRDTPRSPTMKPNLTEELRTKLRIHEGVRSNGNSPSSSGRSTPRGILEPQSRGRHSWASDAVEIPQTCSDRMGAPKTSLMDFKRLLLAKAGKGVAATKPSAVEQLLKKPTKADVPSPVKPAVLNTSLKIQDLSGSPKTFASRRMIRQGNFGSPAKSGLGGGKHMSPRSANWRLNSAKKHDVMSTAIPEANSEEDNSSSPGSSTRRGSVASADEPPVDIKTATKNVVEEIVKMKDNIFLKAEENNFMKHEMVQKTPTYASNRSQLLQAQRAQFLMGLSAAPKSEKRSSPEPAKGTPSLETAL